MTTDHQLIAGIAAGDRGAFRTFVSQHQAGVWRLLRATCDSPASAEDALQETFLAVWKGAGGFRGDASVRAWLLGLARRQAARTWRRRSGQPVHTEPLWVTDPHTHTVRERTLAELGVAAGWGAPPSPEAAAAAVQDQTRVHAALRRLSPADRAVVTLRDLEGLTGPEAAAALDLPLPTLKTRLHRARLRLMAILREDAP